MMVIGWWVVDERDGNGDDLTDHYNYNGYANGWDVFHGDSLN